MQRPGLWEGWEIELLLPGLGRIFCFNTANLQKLNRNTKAEGLFLSPTLPKPLLAVGRNVNERPTIKGLPNLYYKEYMFDKDLEIYKNFGDSITKLEFSKSCKNNFKCCGSGIGINVFETWGF